MSSTSFRHQNSSLSNFSKRGEDDNFMGGAKRASLRSSTLLEHQNHSQSNFSSEGEDDNLMGGPRRASLRSLDLLEHQNLSQNNFSSRGENDNLMGGSRIDKRVAPNSQEVPCNRTRRNLPNKTKNWTNVQLKATLDAITDDGMKVRVVSCTFGIPPSSIRDHLYERVQERKRGAKTILKKDEEKKLLEYLFKM